ncbi:MAG TPA: RNA polymerase sigma factor [Acidobacteriota bacterium]|nr:RNA polymerase sigma factor [Acidobacteriota bacterium]
MTFSEAEQLERARAQAVEALQMDERTFHTLYERTARPLWSYLYRISGNADVADDVMQEAYYRILRTRLPEMNQDYMKNYLFRIATNLVRDHWRKARSEGVSARPEFDRVAEKLIPVCESAAAAFQARSDLEGVLSCMKPGEREMLWLAYVEGSSHKEIAEIVGIKEQSIRPLLFRARRKLVSLLRARGLIS